MSDSIKKYTEVVRNIVLTITALILLITQTKDYVYNELLLSLCILDVILIIIAVYIRVEKKEITESLTGKSFQKYKFSKHQRTWAYYSIIILLSVPIVSYFIWLNIFKVDIIEFQEFNISSIGSSARLEWDVANRDVVFKIYKSEDGKDFYIHDSTFQDYYVDHSNSLIKAYYFIEYSKETRVLYRSITKSIDYQRTFQNIDYTILKNTQSDNDTLHLSFVITNRLTNLTIPDFEYSVHLNDVPIDTFSIKRSGDDSVHLSYKFNNIIPGKINTYKIIIDPNYNLYDVNRSNNEIFGQINYTNPKNQIKATIESSISIERDTVNIPIKVSGSTNQKLEKFEFQLNYNPKDFDLLDLSSDDFDIIDYHIVDSKLIASAYSERLKDYQFNNSSISLNIKGVLRSDFTSLNWGFLDIGNQVSNLESGFLSKSSIPCGDVSGDGNITNFDASLILRHVVRLNNIEEKKDSVRADVTGNGWISAYDASQILRYVVSDVTYLPCSYNVSFVENQKYKAEVDWGFKLEEGEVILDVNLTKAIGNITSFNLDIDLGYKIEYQDIEVPNNIMIESNLAGNHLYLSGISGNGFETGNLIKIRLKQKSFNNITLNGEITLNETKFKLRDLNIYSAPTKFELSNNYPNPFNPSTTIHYAIPEKTHVTLAIYNLLGQKVTVLVDEEKEVGTYFVKWDSENINSGIYVYSLITNSQIISKQMLVIK